MWIAYDYYSKRNTGFNLSSSVTDHLLTPRKTVEKEDFDDTEAEQYERDGGIYQVKSFVLGSGDKLMIHFEDNGVPGVIDENEVDTPEGKSARGTIEAKMAEKNFFTGFIDNLTQIQRGPGTDIKKYLGMIPKPVYVLIFIAIFMLLG